MRKGITRCEKVVYVVSDGREFSGTNAERDAEEHQKRLDTKKKLEDFGTFLKNMFGLDTESIKAEEEEEEFCGKMSKEVDLPYDEFSGVKLDVAPLLLDLFAFLGPLKWMQIYNFFIEKVDGPVDITLRLDINDNKLYAPYQSEAENIALATLGDHRTIYLKPIPLTNALYLKWDKESMVWNVEGYE